MIKKVPVARKMSALAAELEKTGGNGKTLYCSFPSSILDQIAIDVHFWPKCLVLGNWTPKILRLRNQTFDQI